MKDMSYKKREKIVPGFWHQKTKVRMENELGVEVGEERWEAKSSSSVRALKVSFFRFPDSLALS